ncbi:MAG: DUF6385 domain-containing protein [Desulfitobacteriaceae bacterium]
MANFKIFQDNPDQAKVKIFGSSNAALNTDSSGNLTITSTGLAVEPPTGGLLITSSGLAITSTGLAIVPPTGGLLITSTGLTMISATTDVSATLANITDIAGSGDTTYTVLGVETWTFGVVNESLAANAQALVKMQISPDGTNWLDETGTVTINQNSLTTLVTSIFLKYARVYYSAVNAASAVTLNVFFQGEL